MDTDQTPFFLGHVKVVLRSRSPKQWGWEVYRDGSVTLVEQSDALFSYAEDAWREGQLVLASLETVRRPRTSEVGMAA